MTNKYKVVNNDYMNTGGGTMVNITTVLNLTLKTPEYIYIDEEYCILTSFDYIRNELPENVHAEDFVKYEVAIGNLTHEPAYDNVQMLSLTEETAQLFFDCYLLYIREYCKYTKDNYVCRLDALPMELHDMVTREYSHWLAEKGLDVTTDGHRIIIEQDYIDDKRQLEVDTPNNKAAQSLSEHLFNWMPAIDAGDKDWENFYSEKIHIIVGGKLFTFDNGADIYNALDELTKFVISEQ